MEHEHPPWSPHPDAALEERLARGDRIALLGVLADPRLGRDPYARLRALDRLRAMDPADPRLLQAWLEAMLLGNRPQRAWRITGRWPLDASTPAEAQLLAAQVAQAVGRGDEARTRYLGLLERHPQWVDAWQKYVEFERTDARLPGTVAALEDILASAKTDYDREKAGFALARALAPEAPERAFKCASAAQVLKRRRRGLWDHASLSARLDADHGRVAANGRAPCREVFIVGMPRSGTTLMASLLGAHPAIANLGEQNLIPALTSRGLSPAGALPASRSARDWYRAAVGDLAGGASVVVDKLPGNAERCGLILEQFPEALVVHLERDLDDCATSIHMHDFEFGCDYACEAVTIGRYAGSIHRHLARRRERADGRLLHLRFEDLVRGPEAALAPVLERLGLAWDAAMPGFWRRDVQTATYSEAQVRAPVHAGAIGSSRRFLPAASGFIAAVREASRVP